VQVVSIQNSLLFLLHVVFGCILISIIRLIKNGKIFIGVVSCTCMNV